jgi:hypothetical protein
MQSKDIRQCTMAQQTSWWSVHTYVLPWLEAVADWPLIGSPEWCSLPDQDARKKASVLDAARHWALRLELNQEANAQSSRDIAASADWSQVAQELSQLNTTYIPREVA